MSTLVIVESPTKAKTITRFLGKGFIVKSSFGHVRDLPKSKLGIDVEDNYEPQYINSRDKSKVIKELKEAAKKTDDILFATDEDREGEAISWHLAHILGVKPENTKRIVFHEITKKAIEQAMQLPRPLDLNLFDAQQARRILDRLVGYQLSPFLWKKVVKGLSAGRVQSVAVRLVVEREREIQAFKPEEYWSLTGLFKNNKLDQFEAKLFRIKDKKISKMDVKNEKEMKKIVDDLKKQDYNISDIIQKEKKRNPLPPFITSSLQQAANSQLGFSAKQTMRLAQQLYEGISITGNGQVGLITYMRTDSTNLSGEFLNDANKYLKDNFGNNYIPEKARVYKKSKNAQEAHEAIRPTHVHYDPESIKDSLDARQLKLYDLIWRRAMASQMAAAVIKSTTIDVTSKNDYTFRATGQIISFDGYLKLYPDKNKENLLPEMEKGEEVSCEKLDSKQHFTEPPSRYSDATLVKTLEEHGIGRPSTYAPTISTIERRNYVERDENKRLKPTEISFVVIDLLVKHFSDIVCFKFTADMERHMDEIAEGKKEWKKIIDDFYKPFKKNLDMKYEEVDKKELTEEKTDEKCEKCKSDMIIKIGRYGKFMACTNYPDCKNTKNIIEDKNGKQVVEEEEDIKEKCDKCGSKMAKKRGRFGPFLGCSNYPDCKNIMNIEKKTGVKCTQCKKGDIIEKKSKRGRTFYACNQYPDCKKAFWSKPTGATCSTCSELMVYGAKDTVRCSNKECTTEAKAKPKI